jgi:ABC-type amino acid transport substrate-binding protein
MDPTDVVTQSRNWRMQLQGTSLRQRTGEFEMTEADRHKAYFDDRADHHGAILSRRRLRLWRILPILITILTIHTMGCAGDSGRRSFLNGPALRVGISPTYPPVIFEENGVVVGIEADFARSVGDALGRRIVFERYPFSGLIDALESGEIDVVMSGMSITPEREERIRFITPYMKVGQLALIRSSELVRLGSRRSIHRSGVRVGYQRGTTGEDFVANRLMRATSFAFDGVESGIRSLRAGRIDFFVHDAPTVWRLAGDPTSNDLQGLYHPLTEEHLAWAVRPEDTQLHTLLDATLSHWKREGLITPVINRWIPVRVTLH